jgi:Tol biopolymer transport system component
VVWNLPTGTFTSIGTDESAGPAFYPDSSLLAVVDRSATGLDIFIADAATGELIVQVTNSSATEGSLAVSPLESSDIDVWLVP